MPPPVIFISSPFRDLTATRAEVAQLFHQGGELSVSSAETEFRGDESWDARLWSIHTAARADCGVLILNGRYGSLAPGSRLSYTHLEVWALLRAAGRLLVLELDASAGRPDHPRKYKQLLAELDAEQLTGRVTRLHLPAELLHARRDTLRQALDRLLSMPAVPDAPQIRLLFAASGLQSRLWRIVNPAHRSFRAAFKSLRYARELDSSRYPRLASPSEFLASTLYRIGAFVWTRRSGSFHAGELSAVDALLAGGVYHLEMAHPLHELYGRSRLTLTSWLADLLTLAGDVTVEDRLTSLAEFTERLGLKPEMSTRERVDALCARYPTVAKDLTTIRDTDLRRLENLADRDILTWNRLKLLNNALVSLMETLEPLSSGRASAALVPLRDRSQMRFRTSWD